MRNHWGGIDLCVSTEDISLPTIWKLKEPHHTLIVHLEGAIYQLETEFDKRGMKVEPPVNGEFWLVPENTDYCTFTRGDRVRYAEFIIDPKWLNKVFENDFKTDRLLSQVGQYNVFIHKAIICLLDLMEHKDDVSRLEAESLCLRICRYLLKMYSPQFEENGEFGQKFSPERYYLVHEYINDNLNQTISLEVLARLTQTYSDKLLKLFRNSFGTTPAQYIIGQRLRRVRSELQNSKKDITTIAFDTGFSNHSHLTTTFKKHTGITPSEFRNNS